MKTHLLRPLLVAGTVLALASCVDPMVIGGNSSGSGSGPRSYTKLPPDHRGSAYYHQGRYYTGGQHQTGRYTYQGRQYTSRYAHNGQYYYGGQHQNFPHEDREFQHGNFPAGNYQDGNYQGTSWNEH